MAKFTIRKTSGGVMVREYFSNSVNGKMFNLDVNIKENIFNLCIIDVKTRLCQSYLSLRNPKRVLNELGYRLDDFLKFDEVSDFIDAIAHRTQRTKENIFNATFYLACVRDYDLEIL